MSDERKPRDMRPGPYPSLREHIRYLREAFPKLGLGKGQTLADAVRDDLHRESELAQPSGFSPGDLSECHTGKFRYGEHHIKALHRVFGLHHYLSHHALWGEWPSSGRIEDFAPRPIAEFKTTLEDARQNAPGLINHLRRQDGNPLLQMTFIKSGVLGFGTKAWDDPEHDIPETSPINVRFRIGDACHLHCTTPGRGRLAIVTSGYRKDRIDGSFRKFFARLNPILGIPNTVDSEFMTNIPQSIEGPSGPRELLAFYWPAGISNPSGPGAWMFMQEDKAPLFKQDDLDVSIRLVLEAQKGRPADSARPEVALLDYFISDVA